MLNRDDVYDQICTKFWGEELGEEVRIRKSTIVPECTGIWWWRKE
ncbi:hypothetical protein ACFO9Q_13325 [Paenibacillus sp. GCM10023252]